MFALAFSSLIYELTLKFSLRSRAVMYCSFSAKRLSQKECFDLISYCRRTSGRRMSASWIKEISQEMSDRSRLKQLVCFMNDPGEWPLDWSFSVWTKHGCDNILDTTSANSRFPLVKNVHLNISTKMKVEGTEANISCFC